MMGDRVLVLPSLAVTIMTAITMAFTVHSMTDIGAMTALSGIQMVVMPGTAMEAIIFSGASAVASIIFMAPVRIANIDRQLTLKLSEANATYGAPQTINECGGCAIVALPASLFVSAMKRAARNWAALSARTSQRPTTDNQPGHLGRDLDQAPVSKSITMGALIGSSANKKGPLRLGTALVRKDIDG